MKEDIVEEGVLEEQDFDIMSMEWLIEGIWNRSSWEGIERWYWIEEEDYRDYTLYSILFREGVFYLYSTNTFSS